MVSKTEFIDQLDGTAARIKAAFKAGYDAGFSDGGNGDDGDGSNDGDFDLANEWKWYKEENP